MRTFLAVFPSSDVVEALRAYSGEMRTALDRQGVNWVRVDKCHITLCFLGDLTPEEALAKTEDLTFPSSSFELSLGPVGAFPDFKRVKAVFLAAESDSLLSLALSLTDLSDKEAKDPALHLTLAKSNPGSSKLAAALRDFRHARPVPPMNFTVNKVWLLQSKVDGSYDTLKTWDLASK